MTFTREAIEQEIRSNPYRYLESSTRMHSVRHMASPSSRVRSEPAFGFGTEEQRPRPGQRNAWKMEQPREGVSGRSHTPDRPVHPAGGACASDGGSTSPAASDSAPPSCWQAFAVSPGPIYCPSKFGDQYRPPEWTAQGRTPFYLMGGKGYHGRLKEHAYLKTGTCVRACPLQSRELACWPPDHSLAGVQLAPSGPNPSPDRGRQPRPAATETSSTVHHLLATPAEVEFVNAGAVFPGAPRPPGNLCTLAPGVPCSVGAMSQVGRGSNKARTDAISEWLGMTAGAASAAAAAKRSLAPSVPPAHTYAVAGVNEIGRGSNATRTEAIDRFLTKNLA